MDLNEIDKKIAEEKANAEENANVSIFKNKTVATETDKSKDDGLVDNMFHEAILHIVKNDEKLQDNVLDTAKKYTETKMQTIATNVEAEHKKAVFNNSKDACESYGLDEETTPIWATKAMEIGYNIMLVIWLIIGSVTFMPVIFVCKKIKVAIKVTWVAILLAIIIYAVIVAGVPFLIKFKGGILNG